MSFINSIFKRFKYRSFGEKRHRPQTCLLPHLCVIDSILDSIFSAQHIIKLHVARLACKPELTRALMDNSIMSVCSPRFTSSFDVVVDMNVGVHS